MNTKSKLLKSIFVSLILVMGVTNMSAADITSDGTARLYFDKEGVDWWDADNAVMSAYFFKGDANKFAGKSVSYSGNNHYIIIPEGTWSNVILTRHQNETNTPSWNNKWNQTGDIVLSSTSNYISKFSDGSASVTWGTAILPASTGSLSASPTSVNTGKSVTLTPSLTSNQDINDIKSTSYSINPSSGASITNNTFTATDAGTYTVTATITYNAKCYTEITSTATATATITVTASGHKITYEEGTGWTYGAKTTSAEEGATVTFVVNPTAGYRVSVSTDGPTLTGPNANNQYTFTMPNKDVKISVEAKPEQYTITLNKQSGTGGTTSVTATYLAAMPEITLPTRTGYTFNGYFDAASGGTKYYNADGSSATNWDKTEATPLYAQWTANKYTVTFNANGGSGTMSKQSYAYGVSQALTTNAFTRTGYTFAGWNTKADGTGTSYTDKQSVSNLSSTNGATVTLYAQWDQLPPTTVYINPKTGWKETLKIICDGEEANMTPVGCDGYYTAEVPGGTTELKFGGNGEQTLSLTVPTDDKVLYDMTSTNITHLYLKPNSNWTQANARFAAYFFGNGEKWVSMTDEDSDGVYEVNIPTEKTYPNVIFCRMNPKHSDNRWNNDQDTEDTKRLWNQTADLTIPTDGTYCYAVKDGTWDKGGGSWHKVWDNSCWTDYSGPSNTYTVTLDRQDATTGSESVTATFGEKPATIDMPEREGYTFNGYYTAASEGTQIINAEGEWITSTNYVDADGNWTSTDCNITFYAQWTSRIFRINLQHSTIEGYGSGGTSSVTATYGEDMPNIPELPTAKNGYAFMGYWDNENGEGTQYYKADGTSARTWNKAENTTLYAYFKKAEISIELNAAAFSPVEEGQEGYVIANPSIEPRNMTGVTICWKLLHDDGDPTEHEAIEAPEDGKPNQVKFSIAGLEAGNYKVVAELRIGNNCGSGEVIDTEEKGFNIASNYVITVKYTCDGKEIMAASKLYASISSPTPTTAPTIPGYTFSKWVAGDGVTIAGNTSKPEIKFTAIYDGYLTAQYTIDNSIIYFYNTLGWENVYVYFYNSDSWNNTDGTGSKADKGCTGHAKMTRMGESNIWYTDAQGKDTKFIVFNQWEQNNYEWFSATSVVRRGDYNSVLPMFVPIADQTPSELHKYTNDGQTYVTKYYNKGYWMNYPNNSGYKLHIYDDYGDEYAVKDITYPFGENTIFPLQIKVELNAENIREGAHKMWFRVQRNDNRNFGGDQQKLPAINSTKQNGFLTDVTDSDYKIQFITPIAGTYTFTLDYKYDSNAKDYQYHIDVQLPAEKGDYRILYRDAAEKTWSGNAKTNNWYHASRVIKKGTDTKDIISFFINKDVSSELYYQTVASINDNTGNITWDNNVVRFTNIDWSQIDTSGVYNFVFVQDGRGISLENTIEPYTGNYYIRCDAMDGKWEDYKTNPDNRMFYSAFSESDANSFGEKFSHYATKYVEQNHNIKFTIANDYSPCISDTLTQDIAANGDKNPFGNLDENGTLYNDGKYNTNIRFMWNRKTNKISRAYVGPASGERFLILKGNKTLDDKDANKKSLKFSDTQNWIYELNVNVQPGTRAKLYSCYPNNKGENEAQYFRGVYDTKADAEWDDKNSAILLGGSGSNFYDMRVLYDFKTNRLMAAWVPSTEINGAVTIDADVMIMREHQNDATCITLANDKSSLNNVKTVYGVMRFNRWTINNRKDKNNVLQPGDQKTIYERALYFISFPFDVHLSDVFGFGTYGTHWVISTYNGQRRAEKGYFVDNCINEDCTNWDYIWDPSNFVLKANTGYLLSLDLDLMKHDNEDFWKHNIEYVELFFPSTANIATIERTNYTMPALGDKYKCTINFNKANPGETGYNPDNDHRVRDSYWRCIGVPSFANYDGSLYKTKEDAENEENPINWKTNYTWQADNAAFPFLYEWNMRDNSLRVQNTNRYTFKSTFAYLVQNGNSIYWSIVNAKPSNIVARNQAASEINNYEWKLTLSRNSEVEDQTFVRLSDNEQITTEFDFNQDLSKEFNYGRSDIYTLIGYEKAAANSLPFSEQTTLIPLGLSIEYNGDYTIAMPDGTANIGVTLIDTESNTRTNLSAGMEYTLTLNKGDYNNRFFIEISPIQQTPTDIEYVTGDSNSQNSVRKVLIDNILYIVRDGQIFDARGARVK